MPEIKREDWRYYGHAGHYIMGPRCRYHLATVVGRYLVSTVGEVVTGDDPGRFHTATEAECDPLSGFDLDARYETAVFYLADAPFHCACGFPNGVRSFSPAEMALHHTHVEAHKAHDKICQLYATAEKQDAEPPTDQPEDV